MVVIIWQRNTTQAISFGWIKDLNEQVKVKLDLASRDMPAFIPVSHSCVGSGYMLEEAPDSGFHEVWINEKVSFCALSRLPV
jgi:hypothetical protein